MSELKLVEVSNMAQRKAFSPKKLANFFEERGHTDYKQYLDFTFSEAIYVRSHQPTFVFLHLIWDNFLVLLN